MKKPLTPRELYRTTALRKLEGKILKVPGTQRAVARLERRSDTVDGGNDPCFALTWITHVLLESRMKPFRAPLDRSEMPYAERWVEFRHTLRTVQTLIGKIKRLRVNGIVGGASRDFDDVVAPLDLEQFVADLHRCEFMLQREIESCVSCMDYSERLEDLCIRMFVAECQNSLLANEPNCWRGYPQMATALNAALSVAGSKRKFTQDTLRKFIKKHSFPA
jgi:hypothetical protein